MARNADTQPQNRWRSLLRMQPQSGLTIAEFCRKHRCSTAAFYAWRRKLAAQPTPTTPANSPAAVNSLAFLPVRLHQASTRPEPVLVRLGRGRLADETNHRPLPIVRLGRRTAACAMYRWRSSVDNARKLSFMQTPRRVPERSGASMSGRAECP